MAIDINSAWEELRARVKACQKCGLCRTRKNTVFGEGPLDAKCVIVGEAPGQDEDEQGRPFVGRAGQLLTDILEKGAGIPRNSVYIMNVVKCRPPDPEKTNRPPTFEETFACSGHLEAQLALLHPEIVVAMGNTSTQWLLHTKIGITKLRGKWLDWRHIKLLPMYHPSYILRQKDSRQIQQVKSETWQDVKSLKAELDKLQ